METNSLPPVEPAPNTDPLAWAQSVQQMRAAGNIDDRAYSRYQPALEKAFSSTTPVQPTPERRDARIEELRLLRMNGQCTDAQWREAQALMAGEQFQAALLTIDEELQSQIGEIMKPAQPHEYQLNYPPTVERDDVFVEFDTSMREAFAAAGIPRHLGGPIFEAADRVSRELADASRETRQARIAETTGKLQQRWGEQFKARVDAIDEIVAIAASHSPGLAQILDEAPHILADESIWVHLDTIAQHRAAARS